MTSFFLFLSGVFKWSFQFFNFAGNLVNWILFIVACGLFIYWCYELVVVLGNDRDKPYKSPSKEIRPYYDPTVYKRKD